MLIRILITYGYITKKLNNNLTYSTIANILLQELNKENPSFARLYFNPKLHKPYPPIQLRPICSTISTPTHPASTLLDIKLQPYLKKIPTYITNSTSIILRIHNTKFSPNTAFLVADIENYTLPYQHKMD